MSIERILLEDEEQGRKKERIISLDLEKIITIHYKGKKETRNYLLKKPNTLSLLGRLK